MSLIGAVIITHGRLAQELLRAAEMIIGPLPQVRAICLISRKATESLHQEIKEALAQVNEGKGVLILTDMFGGTPSNLSLSFLEDKGVEVISGVNLPMLIKFASYSQHLSLDEITERIVSCGRENILVASNILAKREATDVKEYPTST